MSFENDVWVERYRPTVIEDCVLPRRLKDELAAFIKEGSIPSMLFTGPAGTGKTTAAYCIANELQCDLLYINASKENGVETIRGKVNNFASTMSIMSDAKHKIILLDEADGLSLSAQPMLRGMIEEFSANCRFILTANYRNKIIIPLQSRTSVVDFAVAASEKPAMMGAFMTRVMNILNENGITYDKKALAMFIQTKFPDFRSTLTELQRYSRLGTVDVGILKLSGDDLIQDIVAFLREKNFKAMRTWVDQNASVDVNLLFDRLYDKMIEHIIPQSIPDLILILDEYQNKAAVVVNQRINMAACMTQMMSVLTFK